jgi:hypothetical protein
VGRNDAMPQHISILSRSCVPKYLAWSGCEKHLISPKPETPVHNSARRRKIGEIKGCLVKHPPCVTPCNQMEVYVALLIKDPEVMRLAKDLAVLTGESREETIRKALEERAIRLSSTSARRAHRAEFARILGREVQTMARAGRKQNCLTLEEVQELLAYGP